MLWRASWCVGDMGMSPQRDKGIPQVTWGGLGTWRGGQGPIKRVLKMEGEQEAWGCQPKRSLLVWGHLDVPKKGVGDPQDVWGHRGEVVGLGGDRDTLTARLASQEPTQASVISL